MIYDQTSQLSESIIQHGKYNDRVYLMKLAENDQKEETLQKIVDLAKKENYGKVFAKIKSKDSQLLRDLEFSREAIIPGFFNGSEDSEFFSLFLDNNRKVDDFQEIEENLSIAFEKKDLIKEYSEFEIKKLEIKDVKELIALYKQVFTTYPFPIFDEEFVTDCLNDHVQVFGIYENGELISSASCEIDYQYKNVEMTDFATLPSQRGRGLAQSLLTHMEGVMAKEGIKTAYTIARSHSVGMNVTFAKLQYEFGGTLTKNTNISGGIESMNVWYKKLSFPLKDHH